ncbi:MAG: hypothetical protein ACREBF_02405 [Candidatus Micrarchaeales archaeon]
MPNKKIETENARRLKLYAAITIILVMVAMAVSILPKGTKLQQCDSILISQNKNVCLYTLATSTDNQSICQDVQGGQQSTCYTSVAVGTLSPSTCAKAGSSANVSECTIQVAQATNNSALCSNINPQYSDGCYLIMAVKLNSQALCASVINQTSRESCSSAVDIDLASSTRIASYCANTSTTTNKTILTSVMNMAAAAFAGNQTQLISIKGLVLTPISNYSVRDVCYSVLASKTSNSTYCSDASPAGQTLCNYSVNGAAAAQPENYSQLLNSCNELSQYKTTCTRAVLLAEAINTKNVSICASFQGMVSWECYTSLATKYTNSTYCGYITNSTANNACLLQLQYTT